SGRPSCCSLSVRSRPGGPTTSKLTPNACARASRRRSGARSTPASTWSATASSASPSAGHNTPWNASPGSSAGPPGRAVCVGPISYTGLAELRRDIENFKSALGQAGAQRGFLPVASPTSVIPDRRNEYYKSDEELLHAIADAMRAEYRAIVDAGLELQLDDARLAVTYDRMVPPASFADYRNWVAMNVEAINHALAGIPEERVRYHVCWGSWPGPHVTDVPFKDIVDLVLKVKAGTYLIEGANP